ncbi:hypothetical protein B0T26DRAFT_211832 [Lasiosphaeria miniovina]|uniref:Uncharacterized protein n=1 Tax=Lasiosphaeria miniovina TaxID=1954250 RepID=A0AA40AUK1_9PEZI|nr:uncharacterized protein B0T26DRAFT_211832 [Lasiosphaeria miniovina]KAK0722296.1 hypothetical protein B0T26DRAFT_211832 [Lasiosphaeria miniovina]
MPSSPASTTSAEDSRLRTALESSGVKFHIRTGNGKWACTLLDRATHERQKSLRTSSSSVSTTGSTSSTESR